MERSKQPMQPTAQQIVKQTVRSDVQNMAAYAVPDSKGFIKLDAMENPFGFPPHLHPGLMQHLQQVGLNRYPQPAYTQLKEKLRATYAIPSDCGIILGNGSDELIDIITKACAVDGAVILAPAPGFVMYSASAMQMRIQFIGVDLLPSLELDMPAMRVAIAEHKPALIYLAYPNNPTGNCYSTEQIEEILHLAPGLVVIDEAYQPFALDTWMSRLPEYPQAVVMRTVSKWGLAGIRLGYMAGHSDWINQFEKLRPPYNVNVLTECAALYCLDHEAVFAQQAAVLRSERELLFKALQQLPGVQPFSSKANFITTRFADGPSQFNQLKADGILVKDLSKMHPLLVNCLRLTVGSPPENAALMASLKVKKSVNPGVNPSANPSANPGANPSAAPQ